LAKIPLLTREDLRKEAEPFINEELFVNDTKVLYHNVFTNGVAYVKCLFEVKHMTEEYLPYFALLKAILGYVDTEKYSYGELFDEINMYTGGISMNVNSYVNAKNLSEYRLFFEIRIKAFEDNICKGFELLKEILFSSKFDRKRIREIIAEAKSRVQASLMNAGHSIAALQALSAISTQAALQERMSGLTLYRLLEKLDSDFDNEYDNLVSVLNKCMDMVFRPEHLMLDYTGSQNGLQISMKCTETFLDAMVVKPCEEEKLKLTLKKENSGFMSASQVQYVCVAGNYQKAGLSYTGALSVLKVMMGYEYLWIQVRVKGGAYGCMSSFGKTGDSYFVSYRDPNLDKTIDVYKKAAQFVRNYEADERTLTQYIIGALSEKDIPLTPQAKGSRSLKAYLTNVTLEEEQRERDQLLGIDAEKIRGMADYIEAFQKDSVLCVVGNEKVLKESEALFDRVEMLFQN